jgi:cytochrome c553
MQSSDQPTNSSLRQLVTLSLLCFAVLASGGVAAEGSAERGASKAVTCAACHGQDGNSLNPEWPSLAGQHENYLVDTLQAFKNGTRNNVLMVGQVIPLSDQDMEDIAAYYAGLTPTRRTANPDLVKQGERLYRGGNLERGVSACIACHGPTGRGNLPAGYPSIAGQHATYTAAQLKAYASKERKSDPQQIMRNIAVLLKDDEIAAVASYIQGLR